MFDTEPNRSSGSPEPSNSQLEALPLELIEREIEALAAQVNAGSARWLELVAEFDRREGWGGTGCRSTSEWSPGAVRSTRARRASTFASHAHFPSCG